jgi:hypothetical protein
VYAISQSHFKRIAGPFHSRMQQAMSKTHPALLSHHLLFDALLKRHGLFANTLAAEIGLPTSQGTISKFQRGLVRDPRGGWIEPAAQRLGVKAAALRDDSAAREEAARLGISLNTAREPSPIWPVNAASRGQARIDPGMLVLQIADLMRAFNPAQRELAAPLFKGAAEHPEEATKIAAALRTLLSEAGKQQSTGT